MMKKKKKPKILETRYFGLIIGVCIIVLFAFVLSNFAFIKDIEIKMLDVHFKYKDVFQKETIQEGVTLEQQNPNISQDILILGIDLKSLSRFGKWPFPRSRHGILLDTLSRIQNQNERESAVFLDLFFNEPDRAAVDDVLLIDSIKSNGRVFLETVLDEISPPEQNAEEFYKRHEALYKKYGEIRNIQGNWRGMYGFPGLQPPLRPYCEASKGYGHANFFKDADDIYRRQALVAKSSVLLETIRLDDLTPETPLDVSGFERFEWTDFSGRPHTVAYPHTEEVIANLKKEMQARAPLKEVDTNEDGEPDEKYYVIRKYKDHFIPSITLALALNYFNKSLDDIQVELGKEILIPSPEQFNVEKGEWEPYALTISPAVLNEAGEVIKDEVKKVIPEIRIPIDDHAQMLINFMGYPSFASSEGRQTYPVRSYSTYAATPTGIDFDSWPETKGLGNKIVMVGAFEKGIAEDEKPTPYGLMYGVEIHANALNTILMNKFIVHAPFWIDFCILAGLVLIIAFMSSRLQTVWSFLATILIMFGLFLASSILFDQRAYLINFTNPAVASFFTFICIVVYRAMTEERDKRRIKNMFGTYVSPKVVEQILENPPELGGVDKELTVFFSDIRGFTTLSESMTPQELVIILNKYLTAMTDIILEYEGTLDKYEGDAIMCFWGAPLPQADHALRACKSALKQIDALKKLNEEVLPKDKQINIGIGINSGIMTVGNMGSIQRMDYTLIGDNVNLGARLEGTNKQYGTTIIISENTYGLVKDHVIVRELDNIRVKGKNKPVLIYELVDCIDGYDMPVTPSQKTVVQP